eukprot:CAMPEP_0203683696 /NCGR_PEP_ID=MMETSP0090-20130426/47657_1 /ASSEMBLY_ACC=CAM_ASM_001088 /TAXON_ID=426623 /ORGANISM="Chaetoceros affinis, Strain CCMP159" /LENGTH=535 /DNA_ID=CAMNT_0050552851 /DNA_START=140 /DNA_END=1748 /DNA_ORIENTATION=+
MRHFLLLSATIVLATDLLVSVHSESTTAELTVESSSCSDSPLSFINPETAEVNDCEWVDNDPEERWCAISGVAAHCPVTCGTCDSYLDSTLSFKVQLKNRRAWKDCDWVGENEDKIRARCAERGVSETCRSTCPEVNFSSDIVVSFTNDAPSWDNYLAIYDGTEAPVPPYDELFFTNMCGNQYETCRSTCPEVNFSSDIVVSFTNDAPSSKQYLAIYDATETLYPGDDELFFTNMCGNQYGLGPTICPPQSSGSVTFAAPDPSVEYYAEWALNPGYYTVCLMEYSDSAPIFTAIVCKNFLIKKLRGGTLSSSVVASSQSSYAYDESISVSFSVPIATQNAWIGVYRSDEADNSMRAIPEPMGWVYTACNNVAGDQSETNDCAATATSGTVDIDGRFGSAGWQEYWPFPDGTYRVCLSYYNNEPYKKFVCSEDTFAINAPPSAIPSSAPSPVPSVMPSSMPSEVPTSMPSAMPSVEPTGMPSVSAMPSDAPSEQPSANCIDKTGSFLGANGETRKWCTLVQRAGTDPKPFDALNMA